MTDNVVGLWCRVQGLKWQRLRNHRLDKVRILYFLCLFFPDAYRSLISYYVSRMVPNAIHALSDIPGGSTVTSPDEETGT